jgi:two-component system phosphate regulon sensor histidine kinase PhoR
VPETRPSPPEAEDFVATVAHDLRSPLCSLQAYLGLLETDCGETLEVVGRTYLERIRENAERMQRLIDDLGTLVSLSGPLQHRKLIESREVFLQYAADLKPQLDERNVDLILPEAPPPVYAVRTHFYRVLSNLVSNALDHMGDAPNAFVRLDLRNVDGGAELVVVDNGRGIDPSVQSRIFDRFFPCCSAEPRCNLGMGLTIVKRIMDAHEGSISVESAPGKGATFRAFFPSPQ